MARTLFLQGLLLLVFVIQEIHGNTWCFSCPPDIHPAICQKIRLCGDHEVCYVSKTIGLNGADQFTSDCRSKSLCPSSRRRSVRAGPALCEECCDTNGCNRNLCGAPDFLGTNDSMCLHCDHSKNMNSCDALKVCNADEMCSITKGHFFALQYYTQDCTKRQTCEKRDAIGIGPKVGELVESKQIGCCSGHFCNDGTGGLGGDADPPKVTLNSTKVDVVIGAEGDVTVECKVEGKPTPQVTWVKDRKPLTTNVNVTEGGLLLTLFNVTSSEAGNYTCLANNTYGTANKSVTVAVHEKPEVKVTPANVTVNPGKNVTLLCNITTIDSANITWNYTQGSGSPTDDGQGTLTLSNVTPDMGGRYTCVASNKFASGNASVTLVVLSKPNITSISEPQAFVVGKNDTDVKITCHFTGGPAPKVTWEMTDSSGNETEVTKGVVNDVGVSTLTLTNVTSQDTGNYTCKAVNDRGDDNQTTEVHFYEPPSIAWVSDNVTVEVGKNADVTCNVTGSPPVEVTWSGSGDLATYLQPNKGSTVQLTHAMAGLQGQLTCTASSSWGNATASLYVSTIDPVRIKLTTPRYQAVSSPSTTQIQVICFGSGSPEPTVSIERLFDSYVPDPNHLKIEMQQTAEVITSHINPGGVLTETGVYRCNASNGQTNATEYSVVYLKVPSTVDCSKPFNYDKEGAAYGIECQSGCSAGSSNPPDFDKTSPICPSAIKAGVIDAAKGGTVVWLGLGGGKVRVLDKRGDTVNADGLH